jgi:NTP pyrophosphatase (non-canonical NTP hydrolase)
MIKGLDEYQKRAKRLAVHGYEIDPIVYLTLGLAGEAGEVADEIKKAMRPSDSVDNRIDKIKLEMGDTLWYLSQLADKLGFNLSEIADANIHKLEELRAKRG